MGGHSIFSLAGMGRKDLAATDTTAGREGEPRSEMMAGTPSTQICAALGNQTQGQVGADAVDLGQIDADQLIEQGTGFRVRCRGFGSGSVGDVFSCESLISVCAICWSQTTSCA